MQATHDTVRSPDAQVGIEPAKMPQGALYVQLFDAFVPSTIELVSGRNRTRVRVEAGLCWIPVALAYEGSKPSVSVTLIDGEAEKGRIDVIPNFMAGDEGALAELARESPASIEATR